MSNFRRSERFDFSLQILFKGTFHARGALTEDVSFHGVFIRTDETRAPNQLVKFTVIDPDTQDQIDLLGIVARSTPPAKATPTSPPGIGVSLFGNSRSVEARWVKLIRRVKAWSERGLTAAPTGPGIGTTPPPSSAGLPSEPTPTPVPEPLLQRPSPPAVPPVPGAGLVRPPAPRTRPPPKIAQEVLTRQETPTIDAVKRAHVRRPTRFNVTLRPEGLEALNQFEVRDISEGGTFVLTRQLLPVGSRINLRLVHPTTDATFTILGEVVRSIDSIDPAEKGIGIRFQTDAVDTDTWGTFMQRHNPMPNGGDPLLPTPEGVELPQVQVTRTPMPQRKDPPVLLGAEETPAPGTAGSDPGGAPILLDRRESPVPVILGEGVDQPPRSGPPTMPPLPKRPENK